LSRYLVVQISDVHLKTSGTMSPGVFPRDNLIAALGLLGEAGIRPDVFVLTGDLADQAEAACYDDLAELIAGAASASHATVIYLPGNHDGRETFRRHLLGEDASSGPINQVKWRGGLRVIALDSTVPGEAFGELAEESLEFLRAEIASPAPEGTVVALHHPPIPSPIEPMSCLRLRQPERLADTIRGSDVRLVISGHNHHEGFGTLASVPVWVSPATAYRADVTSREVFRGVPGGGFSLIDIDDAGPMVSVVHLPTTP
jgi:3',5'-cyclic AMP phosphodiesterase CpdA